MKIPKAGTSQAGRIGWLLLWALGVPAPIIVLLLVLRGCAWTL